VGVAAAALDRSMSTGRGTDGVRAPRRISHQRIVEIAASALNSGSCINKAVNEALWDGRPPGLWRDWPPEARMAWDAAVACYDEMREHGAGPVAKLTPASVWAVVRRLAPIEHWPHTSGLRLLRLCQELGYPPAIVSYQMRLQGWYWRGTYSMRRIERAPCLGCGKPSPAKNMDPSKGLCARCRKKQ
jgi:hypothetical protein